MRSRAATWALIIFVVLGAGAYYAYEYIKERPPRFLISLFTDTKPPAPLPEGDLAPLEVPPGFTATIFSRDTPGARAMTRDQKGTLLV